MQMRQASRTSDCYSLPIEGILIWNIVNGVFYGPLINQDMKDDA